MVLKFNTIGEITIKLKLYTRAPLSGAILVSSSRSQAALNLQKWVESVEVKKEGYGGTSFYIIFMLR